MSQRVGRTGNEAAAEALRQVNPDVAAVYPITPQTELMHKFTEFVANGQVNTELIHVESEHSAMSATVGAAAAGTRAITATSANGLALMWEIVYIAASYRLPIVMNVVNRALSGPINIHCDHSDTMGCRDSGWIQIFAENAQEAYDNTIQAFLIGEDKKVLLPVMSTLDGFVLSHTMETMVLEDNEKVKEFVGEYDPATTLLDPDNPITIGLLDLQNWYFEHKRQQVEGMRNAPARIAEVGKAFGKIFGREYGFIEPYMLDDAEVAIIIMGSAAGTAKVGVRMARDAGIKAGLVKLRVFRPWPTDVLTDAVKGLGAVGVMDRCISFGYGGPVFSELRASAYSKGLSVPIGSYIYGLGGRDVAPQHVVEVFKELAKIAESGKTPDEESYVNLRE